jgi:hypothetical protein
MSIFHTLWSLNSIRIIFGGGGGGVGVFAKLKKKTARQDDWPTIGPLGYM